MARVVVDVMLKPEILDPQGRAITEACSRLGFEGVEQVRQGKRFEIEVEGEVDEAKLADGAFAVRERAQCRRPVSPRDVDRGRVRSRPGRARRGPPGGRLDGRGCSVAAG